MLVLLDMDGVLADFLGLLHQEMEDAGFPLDISERRQFYSAPEYHARFGAQAAELARTIIHSPGFFAELPPIEGALDSVHELVAHGHDVMLCTSPLLGSLWSASEKYAWVHRHLGEEYLAKMVLTTDKTVVAGSVLVDDNPLITGRSTPTWQHVVFTQPYNLEVEGPRLNSWNDLPVLLELLDGLSGVHPLCPD